MLVELQLDSSALVFQGLQGTGQDSLSLLSLVDDPSVLALTSVVA